MSESLDGLGEDRTRIGGGRDPKRSIERCAIHKPSCGFGVDSLNRSLVDERLDSFCRRAKAGRPEPAVLHRLREGLVADPKVWAKMRASLAAAGFALGRDDTLVRPPKGFEAAPADVIEDLKLKSWTITRPLSPGELGGADLVEHMPAFAQHASPLLAFGWSALAR